MSLRSSAIEYWQQGYKVFPCLPETKQRRFKEEHTADWQLADVKKHWNKHPDDNIGMKPSENDLVVVDVDAYKNECNWVDFVEAEEIDPHTMCVDSPRGGFHLYYFVDEPRSYRGKIPGVMAVDIKYNGITVLPPSVNADGNEYEWRNQEEPVDAPEWIPYLSLQQLNKQFNIRDDLHESDDGKLLTHLMQTPNTGLCYEDWRSLAMGIHWQYDGTDLEDEARGVFARWCRTNPDYDDDKLTDEALKIYDAFKKRGDGTIPVKTTAGSAWYFMGVMQKAYAADPDRYKWNEEARAATFDETLKAMEVETREELRENSEKMKEAPSLEDVGLGVKAEPRSVTEFDPSWIPGPRPWLHGTDLMRGYVTGLISPGGRGKTSLVSAMALALSSGTPFLNQRSPKACNVLIWSGEDDRDEIQRRTVAALRHHKVELEGKLYVETWSDMPLRLAYERPAQGNRPKEVIVDKASIDGLIEQLVSKDIDVLIIDPFVRAHKLNENDNTHVDVVMQALSTVAQMGSCAVLVVHHVAKGTLRSDADLEAASEAARGATSFVNASRITLALQRINDKDASRAQLDDEQMERVVEIIDAKANMAVKRRGIQKRRFFQLVSQELDNSNDMYPSDDVAVAEAWYLPEEANIARYEEISAVIALIRRERNEYPDKPETWRDKHHHQSTAWMGFLVAEALELPIGAAQSRMDGRSDEENRNRDRVAMILSEMIEMGLVEQKPVAKANRQSTRGYVLRDDAEAILRVATR